MEENTGNGRLQRQIDFIFAQQARFAEELAALTAELRELAASSKKHDQQIGLLTDALLSLTNIVEREREETDRRFRETDKRFRETDERMRHTDERMRHTDERLNALIGVVEGLLPRPPRD